MDAGINADRVLIVGVPLPPAKYDDARPAQSLRAGAARAGRRACRASRRRRSACRSAGRSRRSPSSDTAADDSKRIGDQPGRRPITCGRSASRCAAAGCSTPSEVRRGDRVAVINEAAAKLWPAGENPIGARLRLGVLERPPARTLVDTTRPPEVTIVGVIANTRNAGLRAEPTPAVDHAVFRSSRRCSARWRCAPPAIPTCCSTRCAPRCGRWTPSSRSAGRSRSARSSARKSSSRASRWRCSARSRRSASRSPRPASTACCRSTSRAARTSSASAWRSARRAATCSA